MNLRYGSMKEKLSGKSLKSYKFFGILFALSRLLSHAENTFSQIEQINKINLLLFIYCYMWYIKQQRAEER